MSLIILLRNLGVKVRVVFTQPYFLKFHLIYLRFSWVFSLIFDCLPKSGVRRVSLFFRYLSFLLSNGNKTKTKNLSKHLTSHCWCRSSAHTRIVVARYLCSSRTWITTRLARTRPWGRTWWIFPIKNEYHIDFYKNNLTLTFNLNTANSSRANKLWIIINMQAITIGFNKSNELPRLSKWAKQINLTK